MTIEQIKTDMIGTFGYQSRKNGTLDEEYGFETLEEAISHSMGFDSGWDTVAVEIVEGEFEGQTSLKFFVYET